RPFDAGKALRLQWKNADDPGRAGYLVFRSLLPAEIKQADRDSRVATATAAADAARASTIESLEAQGVAPEDARMQAEQAAKAAGDAAAAAWTPDEENRGDVRWTLVGVADPDATTFDVDKLVDGSRYLLAIQPFDRDGAKGPIVPIEEELESSPSAIDAKRLPLLFILLLLCGTVLVFIGIARRGKPLKIRTIAGLAAVEEAVGRATEMGRSVLYINGIQDMDDLQTVAGVNILGRVAKIAAEYDARVEVPTSRSLVMTAARETVHASYLSAGRSDNYNPDLIYYVTDEQFGFVAYVSGTMVREKPAACFYMGAFFAESLILAETGNSIGAIQIAGTAMPSQLPFFVAACDYTLIGEEFFAASAYLSGQPDQLGSLKGQDMGKLLVGAVLLVGATLATLAAVTGSEAIAGAVSFLRNVILGS
ncbi:MAG: DUF6754 domain-containing protein, partial [Phycisphaerales bacterium]